MKLKSLTLFGAILLASLSLSPFGNYREPTAIKENLALVKIDAQGNREDFGSVVQVTRRGDPGFEKKLAFARAMTGARADWIAAVRQFIASEALANIPNAAETALRDCFGGTGTPTCTTVQAWKYHGLGTGSTAAAETDVGCQTELTTAYNPDSTRATGTQTNNGANIYRTVGVNTVDGSATVTEWCLMSNASVGSGTIWSRVVFAAIGLVSGDSLSTTYDLTIE